MIQRRNKPKTERTKDGRNKRWNNPKADDEDGGEEDVVAYREIETQGKLFFCFKFRDRVYVSVIGQLLF